MSRFTARRGPANKYVNLWVIEVTIDRKQATDVWITVCMCNRVLGIYSLVYNQPDGYVRINSRMIEIAGSDTPPLVLFIYL